MEVGWDGLVAPGAGSDVGSGEDSAAHACGTSGAWLGTRSWGVA